MFLHQSKISRKQQFDTNTVTFVVRKDKQCHWLLTTNATNVPVSLPLLPATRGGDQLKGKKCLEALLMLVGLAHGVVGLGPADWTVVICGNDKVFIYLN